eukprot:TRINITY_DN3540_c0_g1_i2.p1 TRINITY_DN3540_c0_g1~~TRINITY_DN3540_c0_g1_i2.p1  ORF type:complete len:264 (+),score=31.60 TRINITY_DN3540_c0_g1_i2:189-980(+)
MMANKQFTILGSTQNCKIVTERSSYCETQHIIGEIQLKDIGECGTVHSYSCSLVGRAWTHFDEAIMVTKNEKVDYIKKSNHGEVEFFKRRFLKSSKPEMFCGTVIIPFTYQLPDNLPGSLKYESKSSKHNLDLLFKGRQKYTLKATIQLQNGQVIKCRKKIEVCEKDKQLELLKCEGSSDQQTGTVKCCGICSKGKIKIEATINKLAFEVGESIIIDSIVHNMCSDPIKHMKVKLFRILSLKSDEGVRKVITKEVNSVSGKDM